MTEVGLKRKLAAIFSADVVAYSRLMEDNEETTIQTLNIYRNSMSTLIQQHGGRVVDTAGDNLMAEFSSIINAVKCAVEIQKEMRKRNAVLPENRRMLFRVGVNLGDIVEENDRIYGDGVNIAARLEGLAEAGGICISRTAFNHVKNKLELGYEYLGEHSVKNISGPVHVYRVLMEPESAGKVIGEKRKKPASSEEMTFPLPEKPSIAVLPFDNMSPDTEQDYFSDGLTDHIIFALSKVNDLIVIARNSTFTYKGKPVKVQQVAEEMGVRYVLEGGVQKAEDKLRITVQLIDALKGYHLWSESYDRKAKDIFALQDEITMKVVKAMRVKLTSGEQARMVTKGTENLKAYLKYLEAAEPLYLYTKEANARAKQLLEEAIALDPEFSNAYSVLGNCHWFDVFLGWTKSPPKSIKKAFELAQKALSLDDSLAQPNEIISRIYILQKKYEDAISEAQLGVEKEPNGCWIVWNLGWVLRSAGRPEEGIQWMEKSTRLNPIPNNAIFDTMGRAYFLAGRYEEAVARYKMAIKLNPDYRDAHVGLAATYAVLDRKEEACTEVSEILRIEPNFSIKKYEKYMFFQVGLEPEFEGLRKMGLPE
jgi:adenylate cyclase